jgi:ABC-type amino acid transport substrate-binding protein
MQVRLLVVGLLALSAAGTDLLACGDKFLVISRGTRFDRAAIARQPAAILVYVNPSSTLPKALERVPVEATLRRVGYRPTSVSSPAELEQALRQGGWDVVVADLADSAALRARLQGDAAPLVLPVVHAAPGSVLAQARRDYPHVLKGPVKSQSLVEAIDDALAHRQKLRARA